MKTSRAKLHLFNGQWLTAAEISQKTGINIRVVYQRIADGRAVDVKLKKKGRLFWFKNEQKTVVQVAAATGLSLAAVYLRISGDRILDDEEMQQQRERYQDPRENEVRITYRGRTLNLAEWAAELRMSYTTFYNRRALGWSIEKIATTPVDSRRATNARQLTRIVQRFRRVRNQQLIHRISTAFSTSMEVNR
jgi:predicted DNA-binding transcriptional regulator AlpA